MRQLAIDMADSTAEKVPGRIRRIKNPERANGTLYHCGDAWEAADPSTYSHKPARPIDCTDGEWLSDDIYTHGGKLYVTVEYAILAKFKELCKQELRNQEKRVNYRGSYSYLVNERKIDPRVIRDADIGAVPANRDVDALFKESLEELAKQESEIQAS